VTSARQIRVFISSTFRDMHAERDHLVTVVFPELRERVEQLGLEFFDVDLRFRLRQGCGVTWGVPAKDANGETANSWEYCRQWIDRVEPFFVCILGQRYGHRPEPRDLRDAAERRKVSGGRRLNCCFEQRDVCGFGDWPHRIFHHGLTGFCRFFAFDAGLSSTELAITVVT
jgi:hypothetical protein